MSSFKTWLGLIAWNHRRVFASLVMVCAVVGVLLAFSLIEPSGGPMDFLFLNLRAKIIIIILCCVVFFSFFLGSQNARITNWRIAIKKGRIFIAENPGTASAINRSINRARQAKNPTELNGRIEDYEELQSTKERLASLRKQEKELPRKIMEAVEKIEALETKLPS